MKIGLVLSGGFVKGAYQLGVLKALSEYFEPSKIDYVSCASIGAVNGYAYMSNNLDRVINIWNEISVERDKRLLTNVFKSDCLEKNIKEIVQSNIICNNFYVPLVNLKNRFFQYVNIANKQIEEKEKILLAGVSLPIMKKPQEINGMNFYDGGIIDNIPTYPLIEYGLDFVICVYFDNANYLFDNVEFDKKVIKVTFNDKFAESFWITKENTEKMYQQGYERAKSLFSIIFANGIDDVNCIYENLKKMRLLNEKYTLRLTGDVIINGFNKLSQKYISKKIIE